MPGLEPRGSMWDVAALLCHAPAFIQCFPSEETCGPSSQDLHFWAIGVIFVVQAVGGKIFR